MSTGYTADVIEKDIPFREFAIHCMRAFGAMIELRDMPGDQLITELPPSDSWHQKQLKEADAELQIWDAMSAAEKHFWAQARYLEDVKDAEDSMAKTNLENKRLQVMLGQVNAWEPPTTEHIRYKEFMVEQLSISMNDDTWSIKYLSDAQMRSLGDIKRIRRETLVNNVEYHKKYVAEDATRDASRRAWIKAVVDALPEDKEADDE